MKLILKEGKTIPINPQLRKWVEQEYLSHFEAYKAVMSNKKIDTPEYEEMIRRGGRAYLEKLQNDRKTYIMYHNIFVEYFVKADTDPILSRFPKKRTNIENILKDEDESLLTLMFWIRNPKDTASGYFVQVSDNGTKNCIFVSFPEPNAAQFRGVIPPILRTVRHELQHFTQSFYSKLLGMDKWIGLPKKKGFRGDEEQFTSDSGKHHDIPVEVSTDVQDEIEEFIRMLDVEGILDTSIYKIRDQKALRRFIFEFVGIGRIPGKPHPWIESNVFRHYFETNKDIWKWSVGKLLSAINAL